MVISVLMLNGGDWWWWLVTVSSHIGMWLSCLTSVETEINKRSFGKMRTEEIANEITSETELNKCGANNRQ